jgi:hypothetical protein
LAIRHRDRGGCHWIWLLWGIVWSSPWNNRDADHFRLAMFHLAMTTLNNGRMIEPGAARFFAWNKPATVEVLE